MPLSDQLKRLIAANAPLWAGEAEIARTYWTAPIRNRETDKKWLAAQCWKEYVGVAMGPGGALEENRLSGLITTLGDWVPRLDITIDRHAMREELEKHFVEYTHYCLFADVYDSLLEPGEEKLNANQLTLWPEEDALAKFRANIRRAKGKLMRATGFTEGGYCTLYSEGAKLKGKPGVDGRIGRACQRVYDDEFGHMMYGIAGMEIDDLSAGDWDALIDVTCEILKLRLYMRNAQFSHPLSDKRIADIVAGKIEPIAFDYERAETYLQAAHADAAQ